MPTTGTFHAVVPHGRRRRFAATAAAAALAAALVAALALRGVFEPVSPLVAAAGKGNTRPVEGRLSGGFAHKPWSPGSHPDTRQEVVAAAAMIGPGGRGETLHSLGVARLLLGEWDDALDALETAIDPRAEQSGIAAIIDRGRDPALLGDLAVALLARGTGERRPQDLVWAAEAAQAAWAIRRTPETAWNRAVTLEALKLRGPAIAAWRDVVDRDRSRGWSGEARARLRRLRRPNATDEWKSVRAALEHDPAVVQRAARAFPQQAREMAEELLAAGDDRSLDLARRLASSLAAASGEALASRSIAATDAAPAALRETFREGFRQYAAGRTLLRSQQMHEAMVMLASASAKLAGNPFRQRAELYRANAEYYAGDFAAARRRLRALLADGLSIAASPSIEGQAHWILGLMHGASAEWNEAFLAYDAAARAFERLGERENHAAIRGLMAEVLTFVGSGNDAWPHRAAALDDLFVLGPVRKTYTILHEAMRAAAGLGADRVALLYGSELVAYAESMKDPVSIADALITRAPAAADAGNMILARADLDRARGLIRSIADGAMRAKSETNLRIAEARVLRATDPAAAWSAAAGAIERLRKTGEAAQLPQLHYERALAARELHRSGDVLDECRHAIAVTEAQRLKLAQNDRRRAFFDRWSPAYALAITTLIGDGRHEEAFRYAEQSRGRSFLGDAVPAVGYAAISGMLPPRTALVEYAVTDEYLLIWVVTRDRVAVHRATVSRRSLEAIVDRLRGAVETGDAQRFDRASELAHQAVVGPVRSLLPERLIVIPHGALYDLPLAALRDPRTKRYLVEDHEITIAPSAAAILERSGTAPAPRVLNDVVLIGNTTPANTELEPLPSARRELSSVARLYPAAKVLLGRDATKSNVLAALGRTSSAHFAGHAVARRSATAALVLSQAQNDTGYLFPDEIERAPLSNLRLLILAGCATGYGARSSDGPASLGRAFLAAGVGSVIATHWPVDDGATGPLMIDLHRRLRRGDDPAAALRAVQLRALRTSNSDWPAFHLTSLDIEGE